jgi:hypothetical protein
MMRRLMVVATLVCAVGALMVAGSASAAMSSSELVYDSGPLGGGARDNVGSRAGWVIAKQLRNGDLELNIEVRRGDASTNYGVTLYCGPTHANAIAAIFGASLSTNASGAASASWTIPAATLAFCGGGPQTGHVDLDSSISTLAAPVNFNS